MIIQIPPIRLLMKRLINSVLIDETMKYRKAQVLLSIDHINYFPLPPARFHLAPRPHWRVETRPMSRFSRGGRYPYEPFKSDWGIACGQPHCEHFKDLNLWLIPCDRPEKPIRTCIWIY